MRKEGLRRCILRTEVLCRLARFAVMGEKMECEKCWALNELKNTYREDVWGKMSKRDIEDFENNMMPEEHSIDCPLFGQNNESLP